MPRLSIVALFVAAFSAIVFCVRAAEFAGLRESFRRSCGRCTDHQCEWCRQTAEQRGELMRRVVGELDLSSEEAGFPARFEPRPIFRYSDPARGTVAGSVWRLGAVGRPKALLALELNRLTKGRPNLLFEYGSLTTTPFRMVSSEILWTPSTTLYEFQVLNNMPRPEKSAPRRLIQMRAAANRFSGSEVQSGERFELRLIPQPVDRYVPSRSENADGAIFLFAFGTNPEIVLILESDETTWRYAVGRMTGAEKIEMSLDGQPVWKAIPLEAGLKPRTPTSKAGARFSFRASTRRGKRLSTARRPQPGSETPIPLQRPQVTQRVCPAESGRRRVAATIDGTSGRIGANNGVSTGVTLCLGSTYRSGVFRFEGVQFGAVSRYAPPPHNGNSTRQKPRS